MDFTTSLSLWMEFWGLLEDSLSTWSMRSLVRDWDVFQLRVRNVDAMEMGNIKIFGTWKIIGFNISLWT